MKEKRIKNGVINQSLCCKLKIKKGIVRSNTDRIEPWFYANAFLMIFIIKMFFFLVILIRKYIETRRNCYWLETKTKIIGMTMTYAM